MRSELRHVLIEPVRPPSKVLGHMDLLGRLRGRESDSHNVSLTRDEEKIDYFSNRQGELDAFQKRTFQLTFSLAV